MNAGVPAKSGLAARLEPRDAREDTRRQQLIEATVAVIGKRGYARTTLAHVTDHAKLSRGIANFYFKSKEALLLAALEHLTREYAGVWRKALAEAGPTAAARIDALIAAEFGPKVCRRDRVAAWFAFYGEARARRAYARVYNAVEEDYYRELIGLIGALASEAGRDEGAEPIALGLSAMMSGFLQDYLMEPEGFDRETARAACRAYLASIFPGAYPGADADTPVRPVRVRPRSPEAVAPARNAATETLPAWTYRDAEFHALEREHIFKRTWQLVGHVSEMPEPGDYASLTVAGERAFVIRDEAGSLGAFVNTCRHRAAAVAPEDRGHCPRAIVCPYHGWTYGLDGRLKAVPANASFPELDPTAYGLVPLEHEVWHGWVFVRFAGDGPSVATMMAPYEAEIAPYRMADMVPDMKDVWTDTTDADWKNVMDNFLEGYHIPLGHPGLQRLFGGSYEVSTEDHGVARATSTLRPTPSAVWSERAYQALLPEVDHLPAERRRAWVYYSLFPNTTFNVYPHNVSYFQVLPLGPGRTRVRGRAFAHPDARPAMRAARWLGARINHQIYLEDDRLVRSVQGGLASTGHTVGVLSEKETCLRRFHDEVRRALPIASERTHPSARTLARGSGARRM